MSKREIKFRAWLKKEKKMIQVSRLPLKAKNGKYEDGQSVGWYYTDQASYNDYDIDYSNIEDIELMQYIGLKDKNGKEIYEGDIVRKKCNYLNTGETKIRLYKVVWKEEWCAWALKKLGNCTQSCYMYKNELNLCEIVGNIYENSELLEAE